MVSQRTTGVKWRSVQGYFAMLEIFLPWDIRLGMRGAIQPGDGLDPWCNGGQLLSSQPWAGANVRLLTSAIWTAE